MMQTLLKQWMTDFALTGGSAVLINSNAAGKQVGFVEGALPKM